MQLSVKNGIGFICIPKCGSTSVERFMRPKSDYSLSGNPRLKHIRYQDLEEFVFPMLARLNVSKPFMFAVMREPVSWVESWYRFRARDELSPTDHPQHQNYTGNMSFPEYVEKVLSRRPPSYARIFSQFHYIQAQDGSIGVDKIIQLDNLSQEIPPLLEKYNIEAKNPQDRKNVSEKREAAELPEGLKERLYNHLHRDVEIYNAAALPKQVSFPTSK